MMVMIVILETNCKLRSKVTNVQMLIAITLSLKNCKLLVMLNKRTNNKLKMLWLMNSALFPHRHRYLHHHHLLLFMKVIMLMAFIVKNVIMKKRRRRR